MYCGENDNKYIILAWKLGLHPTILARLSSITSNLEKWAPKRPLYHQEDYTLHIIVLKQQTICMEERLPAQYICLAWKLGLHPTILARLSSITSNLEKWAPN
jgi:hypothetical protein